CTVGTVREGLIGDPTAGERMPAALITARLSAEAAALNGRSALVCPWDPASADTRERVLAKTWLSRHRRALDAIAACPVCSVCGGTCARVIAHVDSWHRGTFCTWCRGQPQCAVDEDRSAQSNVAHC
ncbi:MAG: hypothetical protein ACRDQB_01935, partial [Thermocrispum sp.]